MNVQGIKEKLNSDPWIYCFQYFLKALGNKAECNRIYHMNCSPDSFVVQNEGSDEPDKWVYRIDLNGEYSTNGFCSLLLDTLKYLYFADTYQMTPIVIWGKKTLYYDPEIQDENNAFQYYFKPVSELDSAGCTFKKIVNYKKADKFIQDKRDYDTHVAKDTGLQYILQKYIVFNENTKLKIVNAVNSASLNHKTLGVHVRATDFNAGYNHHPIPIHPEEYLEVAEKVFNEKHYDRVFLATDDESVIELFRSKFVDKLYYHQDIYRSKDGSPVHYGGTGGTRAKHKYMLGIDILKDVFTLGNCDALIAGKSNVSECAQIIRAVYGEYDYLNILFKGVNQNNKSSRKKIKRRMKSQL